MRARGRLNGGSGADMAFERMANADAAWPHMDRGESYGDDLRLLVVDLALTSR